LANCKHALHKRADTSEVKADGVSNDKASVHNKNVIHNAIYYYGKADKYPAGSQKYLDHRLKAAGARFNNPLASNDVVRMYDRKVEAAKKSLSRDGGDTKLVNEKIKLWKDFKKPEWQQRTAFLTKEKEEQGDNYSFKSPQVEEQYSEYIRQKENQQREESTSTEPLQKRNVHPDPVHYYEKGDSKMIGSPKWQNNFIKASGARWKDPHAALEVVKNYDEKIQEAKRKIMTGEGDAGVLEPKIKSWQKNKATWSFRTYLLALDRKERKLEKGRTWYQDEETEGRVKHYMDNWDPSTAVMPEPIRFHKRGTIKDPVHYYKKADGQDIGSPKYEFNQRKASAARYNDPEYTDEVLNEYRSKMSKVHNKMKTVRGGTPESQALVFKTLSYDNKAHNWEQSRAQLRKDKMAKELIGSYSLTDPATEDKVKAYHDAWKSRPFTFPDPKYDLPKHAGNHPESIKSRRTVNKPVKHDKDEMAARSASSSTHGAIGAQYKQKLTSRVEHPLVKRAPLHEITHYMEKGEARMEAARNDFTTEEIRKWNERQLKFQGLRWNLPSDSEAVINSYRDKIDEAQKQLEVGIGNEGVLKGKIKSWQEKMPGWIERHNMLKEQKGALPLSDKKVSDQIEAFDMKRYARLQQEERQASQKRKRPVKLPISSSDSSTEPHYQKRTLDAVKFIEKGDKVAKRPAETAIERADISRKWMENLLKTQGARFNAPIHSADVIKMYEAKLLRAKQSGGANKGKIESWEKVKLPRWQQRHNDLTEAMKKKIITGDFTERDPKTEKAIEKYREDHPEEYQEDENEEHKEREEEQKNEEERRARHQDRKRRQVSTQHGAAKKQKINE
jgi:hypothetical protein